MQEMTPEQAGEALRQVIAGKIGLAESLAGSAAGHRLLADAAELSKLPPQVIIDLMSNETNVAALLLRAARAHEECGKSLRELRAAFVRCYEQIKRSKNQK